MNNVKFNYSCVVINTPSNLFYFSGYPSADAVIVFFNDKKYYFTDSRYEEEVNKVLIDFSVEDISKLGEFFAKNHIKECAIEGEITLNFFNSLKNYGIENFFYIDLDVAAMRARKSKKEIELITKAQEITDSTFKKIIPYIKEGITETELACTLESMLISNGADGLAFTSIVAFGENTSMPHARRTNKKLEKNMPIMLDFGAKYYGYCSDMTRTIFFGKPSEEFMNIYEAVKNAQEYALSNVKAGMTGKKCDALARDFLANAELSKYFIHSLGHSLGIDIHEFPNFSPRCDAVISDSMVMTVEPGVYLPGKFGVRIEDLIYFDEMGIKNLTKSPKKLIILE